ncbi:MAG: putative porin [Gammaproteobacteria bacterium]|jgi:predicted porin
MQKKLLAVAIASAMCAPLAAQAVTFKISGHVNRAIRWTDNGNMSDVQHVSHGGSRSRVRWKGSEKIGGGNEAGIYVELGMASNRSFSLAPKAADGGDSFAAASDIRHSAVWFGGNWGKLWLGHTGNSNYLLESHNLSGLGAVLPNGTFLMNGLTPVVTSAGATITTIGAISHTFDTGREDVIKYDSPWLGPVQVSASNSNNDVFNIRANVKANFGGGKFVASIGHEAGENRNGFDVTGGSASFKFSQGTSVWGSYMQRDRPAGGRDSDYFALGVGHGWGNNTIGVQYYDGEDMAFAGDEVTEWSVAFMHVIPKPRIQLYATYHNTDYDSAPGTASAEDVDLVMLGSRIFF